jgi:hypothetical protein
MRFLYFLLSTVLLAALQPSLFAQSAEPWLPGTPQELAMSVSKENPGASAIRLYYSYFKDDNSRFVSEYQRIKILTQAGLDYANTEITLDAGDSIKELKARTIHPDGSIVEFTGKPLEKTVLKGHGVKYVVKTFTLPDVTVGSIVEYSYLKIWYGHRVAAYSEWLLQGELYTVKERFRFRPFLGYVNVATEWDRVVGRSESVCSYSNSIGAAAPTKGKDGLMEIELNGVSTFLSEKYMPPQTDYKPAVICYYGGREFASAEQFWPIWQERISKFLEQWLGKSSGMREAADQAIGRETDPEKKLRKLYARVQQIRNLSFERERTANEEKKESLKSNETLRDVLQHGYGTRLEIDALFVALARAAGFDASLIATSDRHARSFSRMILWFGQLDGVAALVTVNGKDMVLDPGTRFCPFGELDWRHSSATALSFKRGGTFMTTPDGQISLSHRTATLELASDGSARGEITLEFDGQEALVRRLDGFETDEAGKRKLLEDEVLAWLPSGSQAKILDSQGWESTDDPLVARLHVDVPLYASVAGKRLVAPVYFLPTPFKNVFTQPSRSYPMVFSFPFEENDEITLQFPKGYTLEAAPSSRRAGLPHVVTYEVLSSLEENKLVTRRSFSLNGVSFPPEKYWVLQNFFKVVEGGDGTQVVVRAEAASAGLQ